MIRLVKSGIGVAFSALLGVTTFGEWVTFGIGFSVLFTTFGTVSYLVYNFSVFYISGIDSYLASDIYSFVAYTLNFDFIGRFITFYYSTFCLVVGLWLSLRCSIFVAHIIPSASASVRSIINWITGDE